MNKTKHLLKRFLSSLDRRALSQFDADSARAVLLPREFELWSQMSMFDKKHSVRVMHRFLNISPAAEDFAIRASLLHDVGKIESRLGVLLRVVATIIGRQGERFVSYHDHEAIGGQLLREVGSDERTCQLVAGDFSHSDATLAKVALALRQADDI